jgi:hypothetical protein
VLLALAERLRKVPSTRFARSTAPPKFQFMSMTRCRMSRALLGSRVASIAPSSVSPRATDQCRGGVGMAAIRSRRRTAASASPERAIRIEEYYSAGGRAGYSRRTACATARAAESSTLSFSCTKRNSRGRSARTGGAGPVANASRVRESARSPNPRYVTTRASAIRPSRVRTCSFNGRATELKNASPTIARTDGVVAKYVRSVATK